jgi:Predicted membrane protein (DUF2254)
MASLAAFLFLIDYTARLLRPISIVWRIGEKGIKVIESVYPDFLGAPRIPHERQPLGPVARTVEHRDRSAIVPAVNLKALVSPAQRAEGVIEFVPRVGDFVAVGEPLFRLHGGAARIDERRLRAQVAFDPEHTIEQDSTFAFRVIVDVGIKALSSAINDPTTAVLAIDQLHRLLRLVGWRRGGVRPLSRLPEVLRHARPELLVSGWTLLDRAIRRSVGRIVDTFCERLRKRTTPDFIAAFGRRLPRSQKASLLPSSPGMRVWSAARSIAGSSAILPNERPVRWLMANDPVAHA